jgi:hypothetical protein
MEQLPLQLPLRILTLSDVTHFSRWARPALARGLCPAGVTDSRSYLATFINLDAVCAILFLRYTLLASSPQCRDLLFAAQALSRANGYSLKPLAVVSLSLHG